MIELCFGGRILRLPINNGNPRDEYRSHLWGSVLPPMRRGRRSRRLKTSPSKTVWSLGFRASKDLANSLNAKSNIRKP